jgi:uncharacterized protein (TIGR03546 family)
MFSFINIPAKIIGIMEANVSPREIAAGVCLGVFLGLIPLNGPMALVLAIFFFVFRINRISTLLTLPLFKLAYVLGLGNVIDAAGGIILEKTPILKPFWAWVTHLPVIAYLDINNTLVAGGIAVASVVSVPVYFISKAAAAALQKQYAARMKGSVFAKVAAGIKAASLIGPDASSTLSNVGTKARVTAISGVKAFFSRGKAPAGGFFRKRINIAGVVVIAVVLAIVHFGTGLYLSPLIGPLVTDAISGNTPAKVTVENIQVWPLTLSFSMKGLAIFDPEPPYNRMINLDGLSVRISPVALLARRLVMSSVRADGAEINLEGSPDTGFNLSRIAPAATGPAAGTAAKKDIVSMWQDVSEKKDLFGKIYGALKKRFARKDPILLKAERMAAAQVVTSVTDLPKGKLVTFTRARDEYLFEIRSLVMDGCDIKFTTKGDRVDIDGARIRLGSVAFEPGRGQKIGLFNIKGAVEKAGSAAGAMELLYDKGSDSHGDRMRFDAHLEDIDLDAVRFVYEDSLPVTVVRGKLTLSSRTSISAGLIDSRNSVALTQHELQPKPSGAQTIGVIPVSAVVEALNSIDPVKLKFDITGSVERPQFGGFQDSLLSLVKPYIGNLQKKLVSDGMSALGKFLQKQMGEKKE